MWYAHQIWCASTVQTGTPYRVCCAHHFLVCTAHLNWCAQHTILVCYALHIGVLCTPYWCAMHSIFGVHSTLVHYTIMLYSAQSFVYVIHNRIHKICSSIYCLSSLHAVTAAIQGYHFICIPETHKNTCYNNLTENHTMYLKFLVISIQIVQSIYPVYKIKWQ